MNKAKIILFIRICIISAMFPNVGYGELLNAKTFEYVNLAASPNFNVDAGSSLEITITPQGASGTLRCFYTSSGTALFESEIGQTTTAKTKLYMGSPATCVGTFQPNGVDSFHWAVMYSGREVIDFDMNVIHADCSAEVQDIDLGVLPPSTTRTVGLPVTTTGGVLLLTSINMSDGTIKLGGKEDVVLQPGDSISVDPSKGWYGITENSTINVVTSATASGAYTSTATVTLRCN